MNKYITLNEEVKLSSVVAGCMRMSSAEVGNDDVLRFVEECIELGVTSFDHAPVYGAYTVEEKFGNAVLKQNPGLRSKMQLVTKTGIALPGCDNNNRIYYKNTSDWILPEVERSLMKLGTDYLDVLLVHRYDPLANIQHLGAVLDDLVKSGKVLSVGVSNYPAEAVAALQKNMQEKLSTNQVEISVFASEMLFNGFADSMVLQEVPLMAWSPLAGGRVFDTADEKGRSVCEVARTISERYGVSVDTILYAWIAALPFDVSIVTGTMKIDRVKAAVKACEVDLSYDEWYSILAAARGYDVP